MNQSRPDRSAIVVPGGMYGPHTPLLMYAADAAEARGAAVRHIWWIRPDEAVALDRADRGPWVLEQLRPVLVEATGARPLLVGKSLGAFAAPLAADLRLPAVWLTPDLTSDWLVDALRRASAPFLLVGGTADPMWDGEVARQLSPHLLEIEGADHGMSVLGPLAASAAVLGEVATAIESFLDAWVWP